MSSSLRQLRSNCTDHAAGPSTLPDRAHGERSTGCPACEGKYRTCMPRIDSRCRSSPPRAILYALTSPPRAISRMNCGYSSLPRTTSGRARRYRNRSSTLVAHGQLVLFLSQEVFGSFLLCLGTGMCRWEWRRLLEVKRNAGQFAGGASSRRRKIAGDGYGVRLKLSYEKSGSECLRERCPGGVGVVGVGKSEDGGAVSMLEYGLHALP